MAKLPNRLSKEMMRRSAHPPERASLCAIAMALMLPVLLSGPAAGLTQRHCTAKPHIGRHDGGDGRNDHQMLVCRDGVSRQQSQGMGTARRPHSRHGISIELGGSEPAGN
jgi:hypothetical protein